MIRKLLFLTLLFPILALAQPSLRMGFVTGINIGTISSKATYSTQTDDNKTVPALHLGMFAFYERQDFIYGTGVSFESIAFKSKLSTTNVMGFSSGAVKSYDIASYIAVPLITYFKKLPLDFQLGLKPKLEVGSSIWITDPPRDNKNPFPINYLAPFQLDALVGVSIPVSSMRFTLRYERGLINRLAHSPEYKEFDNQFKLLVYFTLYSKGKNQ